MNQDQQAPQAPQMPMSPMPTPEHKIGPIVGVVIIIVLLVLAALYFWSAKLNKTDQYVVPEQTATQTPAVRNETVVPEIPTRTDAEVQADTSLGLDELNDLDKLDF